MEQLFAIHPLNVLAHTDDALAPPAFELTFIVPCWARDMMEYITKMENMVPGIEHVSLMLPLLSLEGVDLKSDEALAFV